MKHQDHAQNAEALQNYAQAVRDLKAIRTQPDNSLSLAKALLDISLIQIDFINLQKSDKRGFASSLKWRDKALASINEALGLIAQSPFPTDKLEEKVEDIHILLLKHMNVCNWNRAIFLIDQSSLKRNNENACLNNAIEPLNWCVDLLQKLEQQNKAKVQQNAFDLDQEKILTISKLEKVHHRLSEINHVRKNQQVEQSVERNPLELEGSQRGMKRKSNDIGLFGSKERDKRIRQDHLEDKESSVVQRVRPFQDRLTALMHFLRAQMSIGNLGNVLHIIMTFHSIKRSEYYNTHGFISEKLKSTLTEEDKVYQQAEQLQDRYQQLASDNETLAIANFDPTKPRLDSEEQSFSLFHQFLEEHLHRIKKYCSDKYFKELFDEIEKKIDTLHLVKPLGPVTSPRA